MTKTKKTGKKNIIIRTAVASSDMRTLVTTPIVIVVERLAPGSTERRIIIQIDENGMELVFWMS